MFFFYCVVWHTDSGRIKNEQNTQSIPSRDRFIHNEYEKNKQIKNNQHKYIEYSTEKYGPAIHTIHTYNRCIGNRNQSNVGLLFIPDYVMTQRIIDRAK